MENPVSPTVLTLQSVLCQGMVSQGPKRNSDGQEKGLCEGQYLQAHPKTWQ